MLRNERFVDALQDSGTERYGKRSDLEFPVSMLTLGSVQFGLQYGINPPADIPSEADVFETLDAAADAGVTVVDTARAYGCAEVRIGRWLASRPHAAVSVTTKVPKLPLDVPDACRSALRNAIDVSRAALGLDRLPLVLVHDEHDLLNPVVADEFEALAVQGAIGQFGASVYDPAVAMRLIQETSLAALQLPISILDRRFERAGVLSEAASRGVAVFGRSVFMRGALFTAPERLPNYLKPLADVVESLRELAGQVGLSLFELTLVPVRDNPAVRSIIVGVDRPDQLSPHLQALRAPAIAPDVNDSIVKLSAKLDDAIVDLSRWRILAAKV